MKDTKRNTVTLDERAHYRVVFAGCMEASSPDWAATVQIDSICNESGEMTVVTGLFDQAALHGLLRSAYARGFPLVSVTRVRSSSGESAKVDAPGAEEE